MLKVSPNLTAFISEIAPEVLSVAAPCRSDYTHCGIHYTYYIYSLSSTFGLCRMVPLKCVLQYDSLCIVAHI